MAEKLPLFSDPHKLPTLIKGEIERIIYIDPEEEYGVVSVRSDQVEGNLIAVGSFINPIPGEIVEMEGVWMEHPKYGLRFEVSSYKVDMPVSKQGIERYFSSSFMRGIGPVMAKRIVDRFGKDSLRILDCEIERLKEIEGIGNKRLEMIKRAWNEHKDIKDIAIFLQSYGISNTYAQKIYKRYGKEAKEILKKNPYVLSLDIRGIGFHKADQIAKKMGFDDTHPKRIEAGIVHILRSITDEGHLYLPLDMLIEDAKRLLSVEIDAIEDAILRLKEAEEIVLDQGVEGERIIYLRYLYLIENGLAYHLKRIKEGSFRLPIPDFEKIEGFIESEMDLTFSSRQLDAIRMALKEKVMIITGGPGTGKTTIIRTLVKLFLAIRAKVSLAAPTGRAAKRMEEATSYEAKTIHRLLEFHPQRGGPMRDHKRPLDSDVLILDEVSMIDTLLMMQLLRAIKDTSKLIMVGDSNQLPSVGPGNVLKDLIESKIIPTVELNEIFRQARESRIVINAHRINQGLMPYLRSSRKDISDFYFIEKESPEEILSLILRLIKDRIPRRFHLDPMEEIQVITPMHKGVVGTENLNRVIQELLNPQRGEEIRRGKYCFRVGDKVMQIRNNYEKGVFNGDIGRIVAIDRELQLVVVKFDFQEIPYHLSELDELTLSYAISVHKSQGSEYRSVIVPLSSEHYIMLQRNLLYTALTRAKELAIIIGTKRNLAICVKNNRVQKRFTMLKERLKGSMPFQEAPLFDPSPL